MSALLDWQLQQAELMRQRGLMTMPDVGGFETQNWVIPLGQNEAGQVNLAWPKVAQFAGDVVRGTPETITDAMTYPRDLMTGERQPNLPDALNLAGMVTGGGLMGTAPKGALRSGLMWRGAAPDPADAARINALSNQFPGLGDDLAYMTAEEAGKITSRNAENYLRFKQAVDPDELAAAAVGGQAKSGWYKRSGAAINTIFGDDSEQFTALLAALSPQTSVESNLQNATAVWANWLKAGRPRDPEAIKAIMAQSVQGAKGADSVLGAWINNTVRALSAAPDRMGRIRLSGPKVDSFLANLVGDMEQITNDAWMSNLTGIPQDFFSKAGSDLPGFGPGYIATNVQTRRASEALTESTGVPVSPAGVQEMGWSYAKGLYESREAAGLMGSSTAKLSASLSDEAIDAVPDFATLFGDDIYGGALRGVGYGDKIDEAFTAKRPPGADLSAAADPAARGRVDQRLERLYLSRRNIERTGPYRLGADDLGSPPRERQPYHYAGPDSGGHDLGGGKGRLLEPNPAFVKAVEPLGVTTPNIYHMRRDPASVDEFIAAGRKAQDSRGAIGRSVDIYDRKGYKGYNLFLSEDRTAGFAISPSGELASVFNTKGGPNKGWTTATLQQAVQSGARWLNGFDTELPHLYSNAGFRPAARIPFDEKLLRADWGDEAAEAFMKRMRSGGYNDGRPDLVFMVYDPDFKKQVMNGVGGIKARDYEHAAEIAARMVGKISRKKLAGYGWAATAGGLMAGGSGLMTGGE